MKLALSMLCENPARQTGLTTLFHEFVGRALRLFPEISWVLFAGPNHAWKISDPRLELIRSYPANDQLGPRLWADHFHVSADARARAAAALITVGFVPARKCLPTVMHIFSLQHLDRQNQLGWPRELYRRWLTRYSWPKADLVITNSDFAAGQVRSVLPQLGDRLMKSYEGLQHEQFHPHPLPHETAQLANELGLRPGYFLWVSNLYPYKQPELLLKAYAQLTAAERADHPLVLVGGDWEGMLERCQGLAKAAGIERDVRFLGWVEERWLAPLYRHALGYCLASREETFGRGVSEAMACATPCVVNRIPIMDEVTAGAALLVPFENTAAVTAALRRLIHEPGVRAELIQNGLKNAQRFNFDALTIERIAAIRRLVLGQSKPNRLSEPA